MSGVLASKQQSQKIFEKLKTKPANKVRRIRIRIRNSVYAAKLNADGWEMADLL